MFKRAIALILSLLLIAAMLPVSALADEAQTAATTVPPLSEKEAKTPVYKLATTQEKIERLKHDIAYDYQSALTTENKESLGGYCGLVASYQLYYRGINTWRQSCDGNDYYDIYSVMEQTTGGYRPRAYDMQDYTLEQALNKVTKNGTQDVYNILVGFEWTNTEAGAKFGHVVFVYAILDGIVYFTESFATSMSTVEGQPIAVPISRFAQYYSDWTVYEGIVVLGCPDYLDNCAVYESDMFAQASEPARLLSLPCETDQEGSQLLRTAAVGERLQVTAVYENLQGQYYYQIADGDTVCYCAAGSLTPMLHLHEGITLTDAEAPAALAQGQDTTVDGQVKNQGGSDLAAVRVQIVNDRQEVMLEETASVAETGCDLGTKAFNNQLDMSTLPEGWYTYRVLADSVNTYVSNGELVQEQESLVLLQKAFSVGTVSKKTMTLEARQAEQVSDGWCYQQGTWYCYDQGTPRTGWYHTDGIDYYLQEDGSVTTGWVELDGKKLLFTATGALRTGWLDLEAGRQYLLSDGMPVTGWTQIEGKYYYFDYNGIMQHDCWVTVASIRRYMKADGSMATGWVELEEGTFGFDINGRLLAQVCQENGYSILRSCDTIPTEP